MGQNSQEVTRAGAEILALWRVIVGKKGGTHPTGARRPPEPRTRKLRLLGGLILWITTT